jgi:hypothetical protein
MDQVDQLASDALALLVASRPALFSEHELTIALDVGEDDLRVALEALYGSGLAQRSAGSPRLWQAAHAAVEADAPRG